MPWPTPQDYNEALQDPTACFFDEELMGAEVRCDRFGMPRPESGNFASVYKLQNGNESWAIRCFLYQIANREFRYQAISDYLNENKMPFFLPFVYVPNGIKCGTNTFPIIKMKYLEAHTFSHYVSLVAMRKDQMDSLILQIEQISRQLQELNIAHGDLQHDNLLVADGKIYLVDYDAMFVPTLAGSTANELGHQSYQHPSKSSRHFDENTDNFSFWVIKNSLEIIKEIPDILEWPHKVSDGLLFSSEDLKAPQKSRLFHFLEKHDIDSVRKCARQIRSALNASPEETPVLSDTLSMEALLELCPELPELSFTDETKLKHETPDALRALASQTRNFFVAPLASSACTELSFGLRTKHKWPEIFNHETDFGYERLHQLIQKKTPIDGEIPFIPPLLHALLEEHGIVLIVFLITTYVACFLCQGFATVVLMLTLLAISMVFAPRVVKKYLKDTDTVKRSPRGRFLTRVSNILLDGRCTIVEFELEGPAYARKIIFKAGVPSHLHERVHSIKHSNYDVSEHSKIESKKTKIGMLYFDQGHTDLPIALCAEGNILFWFI